MCQIRKKETIVYSQKKKKIIIMMIFIFLINFYDYQCESDLNYPLPIKDGTLYSITLLLRHGVRTPNDNRKVGSRIGTWLCDSEISKSPRILISELNGISRRFQQTIRKEFVPFPPNCKSGDLLIQGMEQHSNLGKFYRKILIENYQFLPFIVNTSLLNLRSSKYERCIKSAISFLDGFYPPINPNELFNIITGSGNREFLFPDTSTCHELKEYWPKWKNTTEFINRKEIAKIKYENLFKNFNLTWNDENWLFIGDWVASYYCANQEFPEFFTEELQKSTLEDTAFMGTNFYSNLKGVSASPIWREIFRNFDNQIKGFPQKFHLFSAHDTTIIGLLSSIGYKLNQLPPFRSHCSIEIWKMNNNSFKIRIIFNGKIIPIDLFNNNEFVDFNEFKIKMNPFLHFCEPELQ